MILPWEPQSNESDVAFAAFAIYRDLGAERSLDATSQKLGKNRTTLSEWSAKWRWVSRSIAYDAHLDSLTRKAMEHERVDAARRQAKLGSAMQGVAAAGLRGFQKKIAATPDGAIDLPASDIARLAESGTAIERDALGLDPALAVEGKIIDADFKVIDDPAYLKYVHAAQRRRDRLLAEGDAGKPR